MTTVLTASNVSKRYATYRSNLQRFATWFGANFSPTSEYWANRDVSFSVRKGEAIALIGQNGAGKSTLLKMVTGTVRPTLGNVTVSGTVSAILELGLGFNPEFTGRQNVYHAGGLMGYSQKQLSLLMPTIEEFAEIGEFFDKPTRVYSSGMQARLAFALATAKRPDVLIVDEVLSVGDSYFQHKSFEKIRRFKEQGTAIILVTHNLTDVRALCDRVLLLDKGQVLRDGPPDEIVDYYNAMIADRENSRGNIAQGRANDGRIVTRSGSLEAIVREASMRAPSGNVVSMVKVGEQVELNLMIEIKDPVPTLIVGVMLRDRTGMTIWGTNTWHTNQMETGLGAGEIVKLKRSFTCNLGPGSYSWTVSLSSSDTHLQNNYEWQDNLVVFDVANLDKPPFIGCVWMDGEFALERTSVAASDVIPGSNHAG